jgi:preprotein translocase subunit SecY
MAVMQVPNLQFKVSGKELLVAQCVAGIEMVVGAILIIWLSTRNKKYGIGGQSALIFINLFDSFTSNLKGHDFNQLRIALLLTLMAVAVMAIFENTEKRIPLQRVSIHNIYADKNYLAIKMNPIGVMPAMFSMALFSLMQLLVDFTGWFISEHPIWLWWKENMVLTKPLGIGMYILGLYILSMGFSRVFLNPQETTEQFLKSGDSIQNIHAGKDTKKYLSKTINRLSFFSATMMGACLALPLILQMFGYMEGSLAALPSSAMFLVGIVCNIIREFAAVRNLEGYKPFI